MSLHFYHFSCKDKLDSGEPLYPDEAPNEKAMTILEYDITSTYGFCASKMKVATGFCTGYKLAELGYLKRTDHKARHKTFEFLSVYYTLWRISKGESKIVSVFSNFHLLGVFFVGPYPIDLTVILQDKDGKTRIDFYQFDGQVNII